MREIDHHYYIEELITAVHAIDGKDLWYRLDDSEVGDRPNRFDDLETAGGTLRRPRMAGRTVRLLEAVVREITVTELP